MKILVSPGFGAGWSTWADDEIAAYVRTYQPIIDAIENDKDLKPYLDQLHKDLEEKFGDSYFYDGGADQLEVLEVEPPFYIDEYDGSESVVFPNSINWITE